MEDRFIRSADGTRLHIATWPAEGPPRGDLVLLHGLAEHVGRYAAIAPWFTAAGYRVTALEFRGHGDSEGRRGHVSSWSRYVEDVLAVLAELEGPVTLVAHSMGGLVALGLLDQPLPRPLEALVVTNPLLEVAVEAPAWKTALAGFLSKVVPWLPIGNELDPALLSHDPAICAAYAADPKVFSVVTPRWYTEMHAAQARVLAAADSRRVPVLMVTSDGDRICRFEVARAYAARYGGPLEELRFPGMYHEVMNEIGKEQVFEGILGWLRERSGEATPAAPEGLVDAASQE